MPSYSPGRTKPWRARVRYQGLDILLAYCSTREEAKALEDDFWANRGGRRPLTEEVIKLIGRENVRLLAQHNIGFRRRSCV